MSRYGQYCPIAKAIEVVGDRWTLLIVRDMLTGANHFNDLERGLPGISRGLLAARLRWLQQMGVVEKIIPLPESYTEEGLRSLAGVTYIADNSKAKRELGFNPRPLKEGLRETLEHEMKLLGMK